MDAGFFSEGPCSDRKYSTRYAMLYYVRMNGFHIFTLITLPEFTNEKAFYNYNWIISNSIRNWNVLFWRFNVYISRRRAKPNNQQSW